MSLLDLKSLISIFVLSVILSAAQAPAKTISVDRETRNEAIVRAQVWAPVPTESLDVYAGPTGARYQPGDLIDCDYIPHPKDKPLPGQTPKFLCRTPEGEKLKIKYAHDPVDQRHAEVVGAVIGGRLLWALGFGADNFTPVHVRCHGCTREPWVQDDEVSRDTTYFDFASLEQKFPGDRMILKGHEESGWAWSELKKIDPRQGGAPHEQTEALKLMAVLLQHVDNKPDNQRLVCQSHDQPFTRSFMYIHDIGTVFSDTEIFSYKKLNFDEFAATPVFKEPDSCVTTLKHNPLKRHTMHEPLITEDGRRFLLTLLSRLTRAQVEDAFRVARIEGLDRKHGAREWAAAFILKVREIAAHAPCPPYRDD